MTHTGEWIGVDVSKRFLDVYVARETPFRVANSVAGRSALTERLRAISVRGVVLEATGGLERPVLAALVAADLPGSIVNPARVRAFAEGTGQLAKTDRIDAKVLASYGAYMKPAPSALPSSVRAKLKELLSYRAQIGEEITARCAQLKLYETDSLQARAQAALETLRAERTQLEREIESLIASDAELSAPFKSSPPRPRSAPSWRPLWWPNCRRSDDCVAAASRLSPALHPFHATVADGAVIAPSVAVARMSAKPSSTPPAWPSNTTTRSRPSTSACAPAANPARSPSSPLCASFSPSSMPWSRKAKRGSLQWPDALPKQNGCYKTLLVTGILRMSNRETIVGLISDTHGLVGPKHSQRSTGRSSSFTLATSGGQRSSRRYRP